MGCIPKLNRSFGATCAETRRMCCADKCKRFLVRFVNGSVLRCEWQNARARVCATQTALARPPTRAGAVLRWARVAACQEASERSQERPPARGRYPWSAAARRAPVVARPLVQTRAAAGFLRRLLHRQTGLVLGAAPVSDGGGIEPDRAGTV